MCGCVVHPFCECRPISLIACCSSTLTHTTPVTSAKENVTDRPFSLVVHEDEPSVAWTCGVHRHMRVQSVFHRPLEPLVSIRCSVQASSRLLYSSQQYMTLQPTCRLVDDCVPCYVELSQRQREIPSTSSITAYRSCAICTVAVFA